MRKIFAAGLTLFLLAGFAVSAEAKGRCGNRPPGINRRQHNQHRRINQGVRSGELTGRETLRLSREQFSIRREERQARADGVVTLGERRELQQELNQASRHIYRAKHNDRDRN